MYERRGSPAQSRSLGQGDGFLEFLRGPAGLHLDDGEDTVADRDDIEFTTRRDRPVANEGEPSASPEEPHRRVFS